MDLSGFEEEEIEALLHEQATLLFKQCDCENKNYITKDDLITLATELELPEETIIEAFDRLDTQSNGYLTLREFVKGFGFFLGIEYDENLNKPVFLGDKYEKINQLFTLCDTDDKGYVTKLDLNNLTTELGLSKEQIEDIFMKLDFDGDGFISLEEFIDGFSTFMETDTQTPEDLTNDSTTDNSFDEKYFTDSRTSFENNSWNSQHTHVTKTESSHSSERSFITRQMSIRYESGSADIDNMLNSLEDEVGSTISKDQLKDLWDSVSTTSDQMTTKLFENFLTKVYSEIKTAKLEARNLEDALERKAVVHNEEIKRIYTEMEEQLQTEKAKQSELERQKELSLREDLHVTLVEKEKQLEKFMQRQTALENRLHEIKEQEQHLKHQNTKLLKENVILEDQLNNSMSNLEELKTNLYNVEVQTTKEKKETLKAAFQATQDIQNEHENLVKQLDLMKSMNQKLRDDRDTIEASLKSNTTKLPSLSDELGKKKVGRTSSNMDKYFATSSVTRGTSSVASTSTPTHSPLKKQGSILSNYFETMGDHMHPSVFDDELGTSPGRERKLDIIGENERENSLPIKSNFNLNDSGVENISAVDDMIANRSSPNIIEMDSILSSAIVEMSQRSSFSTPSSPRRPPIGMNDDDGRSVTSSTPSLNIPPENPNRVYKVVFVGDSGVGKSSFIHRFCFDDFRPNFTATIGVDYQVKTIKVNRQWTALQLWDTAGQERFRSITKQYFRRADGVIVMFDLTDWGSYGNVKQWMMSVEEGAEPDCVIMLLGNKQDLVTSDESLRKVKYDSAEKTAKDYNAMYGEVSARSGGGVLEAMEKMAKTMELSEDSLLKNSVLNLDVSKDGKGKKKCCS